MTLTWMYHVHYIANKQLNALLGQRNMAQWYGPWTGAMVDYYTLKPKLT